MNYTKTIRNYLKEKDDGIFDFGYEYKERFYMMPFNTYFVVIKRLEDEGLLIPLDKGTYKIVSATNDEEDVIADYYAAESHGMVLGYKLFNKMGISTKETPNYEILSNRISTTTKHIKEVKITRYDCFYFDDVTKSIITVLEILKYGFMEIEDYCPESQLLVICDSLCKKYEDETFKEVISKTHYTLKVLREYARLLNIYKVKNNAMNIVTRGVPIE